MKINRKSLIGLTFLFIIAACYSETLFEVKDSSNNKVLDVSTDGLRILNQGDTVMVISSNEIKANLESGKGLSRTFSVTTSSSKGSGIDLMKLTSDSTRFWISDTGSGFGVAKQQTAKAGGTNVFEVSTSDATMREGSLGERYTDFSTKNIFLGLNAGKITVPSGIYGINNLFIGNNTGINHTTGIDNIFIGNSAGYITNYGSSNVFLGFNAGYNNKTGGDNVYIGKEAGKGYQSGSIYSNGDANVAIGVNSGYTIKTAGHNVFSGYWSGYRTTDGDENVFIGSLTGFNNTTQSNNVYMGYAAGAFNLGDKNVWIGSGDDDHLPPANTSMSGSVFLGFGAGTYETASNRLYIENRAVAKDSSLIYGEFDNDLLQINGLLKVRNLQISALSTSKLGLNGDILPYLGSTGAYDLGNNVANEYWDDVVALEHITYSDKNTKDDIKGISYGLKEILKLKPVSYKYKKEISPNDKVRLGLIAQDVEAVIPEAVVSEDIDFDPVKGEKKVIKSEYKALNYDELIPVLVKALQEQQILIDELYKANLEQNSRINDLEDIRRGTKLNE